MSAGANVKALQRMLGHAKASMTLDTYADLFDDDLDAVAAAWMRPSRKHPKRPSRRSRAGLLLPHCSPVGQHHTVG